MRFFLNLVKSAALALVAGVLALITSTWLGYQEEVTLAMADIAALAVLAAGVMTSAGLNNRDRPQNAIWLATAAVVALLLVAGAVGRAIHMINPSTPWLNHNMIGSLVVIGLVGLLIFQRRPSKGEVQAP